MIGMVKKSGSLPWMLTYMSPVSGESEIEFYGSERLAEQAAEVMIAGGVDGDCTIYISRVFYQSEEI